MRGGWTGSAKSIGLALLAVVICVHGDETEELHTIEKGGQDEVVAFVKRHMEPLHAVAVVVAGKGTARHRLLEDLAKDEVLKWVLAFGIQHSSGPSSLFVHTAEPFEARHVEYRGKWTRGALKKWLMNAAFPTVNRMGNVFAPRKYLSHNPFGVVLIVKPITKQDDDLVRALEPYAEEYRDRLKFTFLSRAPGINDVADMYGVWKNDEVHILERPRETNIGPRGHSSGPPPPRYLLEGVTPESIADFFAKYKAGTLPLYYKPAARRPPPETPIVFHGGFRELTGWDFVDTVQDPAVAVLAYFYSQNCSSCDEFADTLIDLDKRVAVARRAHNSPLAKLVLARIDQSVNEHPELVPFTPHLRYYPHGPAARKAKSMEVQPQSAQMIFNFLEGMLEAETEGEAEL